MPSARHWHGGQLAAAWLAGIAVALLVGRALRAGVYQARIDGFTVRIVSGLWPSSFAAALTMVTGIAIAVTLIWLTVTWFAGSEHRERLEAITEHPFRRPLM